MESRMDETDVEQRADEAEAARVEAEEAKDKAATDIEVDGRDFRVEGNDVSGYLGVSPEYMTYANETEKPILTDEEKWEFTDQLDHLEGNMDETEDKSETDENVARAEQEKEKEEENSSTPPHSHNPPVSVPGVMTPRV